MAIIWQCASQPAQREIEMYRWDLSCQENLRPPEGQYACRVIYKKDGATEVLWQARNDADYCEPRARALVAKLQQAGFECAETDARSACDETPQNPETSIEDAEPAVASETTVASEPGVASEPAVAAQPNPVAKVKVETAAELRRLLQKYYEEDYLEAMIAAIPAGFEAQSDMDVVSSGPGENLHVGPPDHFIKTMSDGSYVLVNTLLLERDKAPSFVNLGFQVRDKHYRFLGYAVAESVIDSQVLDADQDKIVLSVAFVATKSCDSTRRMKTVRWESDLMKSQFSIVGCDEPNP